MAHDPNCVRCNGTGWMNGARSRRNGVAIKRRPCPGPEVQAATTTPIAIEDVFTPDSADDIELPPQN